MTTEAKQQDERGPMISGKRFTKASLKKFVKENREALFVRFLSSFDGMIDCVSHNDSGWMKAEPTDKNVENSLGISGAWLVLGGGDRFRPLVDEDFYGVQVNNCCGSFQLGVRR